MLLGLILSMFAWPNTILEVILTMHARRKGWGLIALLPIAVGYPIGIFAATVAQSLVAAVIADLMIYAALITMLLAAPKRNVVQLATPAAVPSPEETAVRCIAA